MGSELNKKIEGALRAACQPEDDAPYIELKATSAKHVGGIVLSKVFEHLDPAQRQDRIWQKLDEALSPYERTLISFLLTETPDEYAVVRQYPTLDTLEPEAFARAVEYHAGDLAKRNDAKELAQKARVLASYAKTGEGMSDDEAASVADEIAAAIGYAPVAGAPEDGYGIVLLGAKGRAKLRQGSRVTAKELHVLATLVHGSREPISGDADGTIANATATAYLARRGIRP